MAWQLTDSLEDFERAAAGHLRADPVRQTVPLSVLASLRHSGPSAFGADPPVFGWHQRIDGTVDGAVLQTPPFPLLVGTLPAGSVPGLLAVLAAERGLPAAVNLAATDEADFLTDWTAATRGAGTAGSRSRLYLLGSLVPPEPAPPGAARLAGQPDVDLLVSWSDAFLVEAGGAGPGNSRQIVADRLSHDGLTLWETGGEPVAMASLTRIVAGVARVIGVYTPPARRRRGYAGAVTAAVSRAALAAGATGVVLYTDLANPTSNALYQRLGYRPVADRVLLRLTTGPDVTAAGGKSSLRS
ncbi:MAG: GNAT family N-acetyltransferase [Streptosporangiaceae bacterium]